MLSGDLALFQVESPKVLGSPLGAVKYKTTNCDTSAIAGKLLSTLRREVTPGERTLHHALLHTRPRFVCLVVAMRFGLYPREPGVQHLKFNNAEEVI